MLMSVSVVYVALSPRGMIFFEDRTSLLVAANTPEQGSALVKVTLDGRVSVLVHSSNTTMLGAVSSPDGRSLAIAETRSSNDVWEIENF